MKDPWKEATDWVREEFEREKQKELDKELYNESKS